MPKVRHQSCKGCNVASPARTMPHHVTGKVIVMCQTMLRYARLASNDGL